MKIKEAFRMLIRAGLSIAAMVYSALYTWKISFSNVETVNDDYAKVVLGFLLGTLVTTIVNFYLGGTDHEKTTNDETPNPIPDYSTHGQLLGGVCPIGAEVTKPNDNPGESPVDE